MRASRFKRPQLTIKNIQQALAAPLPGLAGQAKMAPQPPAGNVNRWRKPDDCREAAVLVLLYPHETNSQDAPLSISTRELYIALMRRPEYAGVHSGQISFPGGRREGDELLQTTALRETMEEIGVHPEALEVIGQLSSLYIPPSNFCIYPFVALSQTRPVFRLDAKEVAELIEAPLRLLLDPAICREEIWYFQNQGERRVPFFDIFGHKVWGATAMILGEFLMLLTRS